MIKKQDPTWMILAIVSMALMLIFLIGWLISASNSPSENQLEKCENDKDYFNSIAIQFKNCFENDLDICEVDDINQQYGYS